jgi:integrase
MSIYRTANAWGVDWRDEHNRRHRRQVPTEQAALTLHKQLADEAKKARADLRTWQHAPSLTLQTAIDLHLSARPVCPHTRATLRHYLSSLVKLCGDIPITNVTPQLLGDWLEARKQRLSPPSLTAECIAVRCLFRYLREHWHLIANPAEFLPTRRSRASAGHALSPKEEANTLAALTSPRSRAQLLLGLDAGLRRGEVITLRNNAINRPAGEIIVWPSKPGQPRLVPMTPRLHNAINALVPNPAALQPDARIFTHLGKPIAHRALLRHLRARGAPRFRFHDLRHTFASRLASAGVQPHLIRALLGHAPQSTTDLYLHPTREDLHQAILLLAEHNAARYQPATTKTENDAHATSQRS